MGECLIFRKAKYLIHQNHLASGFGMFMGNINISEEKKRKLPILNTVLLGIIGLAFVAFSINIVITKPFDLVMELVPGGVFVLFALIYLLARRGFLILPSVVLISLLSLLAYYLGFRWGTGIPQSWTIIILTVVISGILISSRAAIVLIFFHSVVFLSLTYLQVNGKLPYDWWDSKPTYGSIAVMLVISGIVALISWLSNREIENALRRAGRSEEELRKERDMLEVKVEERTRQIRNEQMKQIMELYRFADFGRLAAGLFHDLVDPLSVISLNLENLKHETRRKMLNDENKATIRSALKMVMENEYRIEEFVKVTRRQLQGQQTEARFNLKAEIDRVIVGLTPKANASRVSLDFRCPRLVFTFGNPVRFHQLMLNLVSNAIDAYDGVRRRKNRMVIVELVRQEKQVICSVEDFGSGIPVNHLSQIFTPFFTTKRLDKGIGIGLSIVKDIVEKDFKGVIDVKSRIKKGSIFTVQFPLVS